MLSVRYKYVLVCCIRNRLFRKVVVSKKGMPIGLQKFQIFEIQLFGLKFT